MKIIFGSHNPGKIREIKHALLPLSITVQTLADIQAQEIPETGLTFIENALLKARHASKISGLPALADDSGLVVHALHGKPGIYSARFAGIKASSEENIQKLLELMKDVPDHERDAHFYCVLAYLSHDEDPEPVICEGIWHGVILREKQGENGFGYDPIFFDREENHSAAELPLDKKNQISHRGKAIHSLLQRLKNTMRE
jgi:XTP/dITP diphosphohydrolase